ncbi:extensin [Rhodoferax koreense]|uniref:Extensin n=1 Tax=Rhodoferax koreensis TaxID=1842727 RepID=A0A1P8K1B8_9BURK|nr:extensin family protein [Rhodoferax koreense]APW39804.1 extensin [Rhodoferax koreense]
MRVAVRRGLALLILAAATALGHALYTGALVVPERFNPWAPLNVMAEPNFLTGYKLSRSRADPERCLAALARTGMAYEPVPDRSTGVGCGFTHAVRLRDAGLRIGAPLTLSCPMALSFFMWEKHALQPAAQRHFGQRITGLQHFGSYACRNINTGEGSAPGAGDRPRSRSRHATADALDIAGFTLQNGRRITVLQDWKDAGTDAEARMLGEAHDGACRFFTGVLGPAYNAVHRDHFHLETGGYSMCR